MPLLRNDTFTDENPWVIVDDEAELPTNRETLIVSLQRWLQLVADGEALPGGVSVAPDDNVDELEPSLSSLTLIAIQFPVYTDGRGYSHARLLRKRFKFTGELRAIGDIRADQILFMKRMGINAFDSEKLPDAKLLASVTERFEHNYQPSYPLP